MKTANLLPAWYLQQQRRQRYFRLHIGAMVLLGAAMIAASVYGRERLAVIEHQRDALAAQSANVPDPEPALRHEQADLQRLEDLRQARKELGNTVPMSAVIQQLQNDMTDGMALSNVSVDVRAEPVPGSGMIGDQRNPPRYRDVAHLSVIGIAPVDKMITTFIDRLSKNPLFTDVALDYTRSAQLQGYGVRKFEIQLSMDLDKLSAIDSSDVANSAAPIGVPTASGGPVHGQ
jgi:hypothetical protein